MQLQDGLPFGNGVARLDEAFDAGGGADRILFAGPAGTEPPGGHSDRAGLEARHETAPLGQYGLHKGRGWERGVRVSALGAHHRPPGGKGRAVLESLARVTP